MGRTAVLAAVLIGCAAPSWAGDLAGTVAIKSPIRVQAHGSRSDPRYNGVAHATTTTVDETRNIVIYVEQVDEHAFTVPKQHPLMAQENKEFNPNVLPIVAGQTVDFPNKDPIFHDVYSESQGNRLQLPGYKSGASVSHTFTHTGQVELFCGIHSFMNGYILVLQNPFFGQPDSGHHYLIKDIPAGTYKLKVWHPRLNEQTLSVTVPKEGTVKLDISL